MSTEIICFIFRASKMITAEPEAMEVKWQLFCDIFLQNKMAATAD